MRVEIVLKTSMQCRFFAPRLKLALQLWVIRSEGQGDLVDPDGAVDLTLPVDDITEQQRSGREFRIKAERVF